MPTKPTFGTALNSNPLNADVIEAWLIAEGTGASIVDSKTAGTAAIETAAVEWDNDGPFGTAPVLKLNGGYANGVTPPSEYDGTEPYASLILGPTTPLNPMEFSAVFWFKTTAPEHYSQMLLYKNNGNTDYDQGFYVRYIADPSHVGSSGFGLQVGLLSSGSSDCHASYNLELSADTWYQLVVTTDGSFTGAGIKLYLDAEEQTAYEQVDGSVTQPEDSECALIVGSVELALTADQFTGAQLIGEVDTLVFFNRALTGAEVTSLYGDPYQLWGSGGGGGGGSQTIYPDSIASAESWGRPRVGAFQPGVAY